MKTALLVGLAIFGGAYLIVWVMAIRKQHKVAHPDLRDGSIGFVTNFFDTLGIGSFATTTSFFKLWKLVPDEQIPGTLNVGHTIPTIVQAAIYMTVVEVDVTTMVLMIAASMIGAWLGAGVVSSWSRRTVQIGMGTALLVMAGLLLAKQLHLLPGGGVELGLTGGKLLLAVAANAMLGALMTLGIGLYAPCMIVIALLGMNPKAAYPIMMGSCAFLMPAGSARFVRGGKYNLKSALGLTLGGIPGVLIAAYVVKELPLSAVLWLVVVVVIYTGIMMLRSAVEEKARTTAIPAQVSGD